MKLYKRYIDVIVYMTKEKKMVPLAIYWNTNDGRKRYEIEKIYEIRRQSSRVGGTGIRYYCKIGGKQRYLFFERNRWFLESHKP